MPTSEDDDVTVRAPAAPPQTVTVPAATKTTVDVPAALPTTVDMPRAQVDDEATRLKASPEDEATRLNRREPAPAVKRKPVPEQELVELSVVKRQRARRSMLVLLLVAGAAALLLLFVWRDQRAARPEDQQALKHGKEDSRSLMDRLFHW